MNDAQVTDLPLLDTENLENGYQFCDGSWKLHIPFWYVASFFCIYIELPIREAFQTVPKLPLPGRRPSPTAARHWKRQWKRFRSETLITSSSRRRRFLFFSDWTNHKPVFFVGRCWAEKVSPENPFVLGPKSQKRIHFGNRFGRSHAYHRHQQMPIKPKKMVNWHVFLGIILAP